MLGGVGAASKDHTGEATRAKVMLVDYVRMGDFEFDPRKFVIRKNGIPVKLTPKEFNILLTLARNPGKLVSRGSLKQLHGGMSLPKTTGASLFMFVAFARNSKMIRPIRATC